MDPDGRDSERQGEGMSKRSADQKRTRQAGAFGIANSFKIHRLTTRSGEHFPGQRHEAPDMVAGGELGHDAPVGVVHRYLGVHGVRKQTPGAAVVERDAGFVAGSLDAEDQHAGDFDTIQPLSRAAG